MGTVLADSAFRFSFCSEPGSLRDQEACGLHIIREGCVESVWTRRCSQILQWHRQGVRVRVEPCPEGQENSCEVTEVPAHSVRETWIDVARSPKSGSESSALSGHSKSSLSCPPALAFSSNP